MRPIAGIRLLGQFEISLDGETAPPLESAQAKSLLAYLLLHRDTRIPGSAWRSCSGPTPPRRRPGRTCGTSCTPCAATREVYEGLLPPEPERPATPSAAQVDPPLVGRAPQWARLMAAWRATVAGRAQFALLSGEPGVGKTRLAEDFLPGAPGGVRSRRTRGATRRRARLPTGRW